MVALHMSGTVAHALADTLKPVLRADGTWDLADARKHDVVEHDRSLTRLDFRQGDNYSLQPQSRCLCWGAPLRPLTMLTLTTCLPPQCCRP